MCLNACFHEPKASKFINRVMTMTQRRSAVEWNSLPVDLFDESYNLGLLRFTYTYTSGVSFT